MSERKFCWLFFASVDTETPRTSLRSASSARCRSAGSLWRLMYSNHAHARHGPQVANPPHNTTGQKSCGNETGQTLDQVINVPNVGQNYNSIKEKYVIFLPPTSLWHTDYSNIATYVSKAHKSHNASNIDGSISHKGHQRTLSTYRPRCCHSYRKPPQTTLMR